MDPKLRLEIVHEVPGRLRARCPDLATHPALEAEFERLGAALPGADGVSVHPRTCSVVFRYSLEDTSPATFRAALSARANLVRGVPDAARPAAFDGGKPLRPLGAEMIRATRRGWRQADRWVSESTEGRLDLRSSVPWVMLFLALRQIALHSHLPALPWYTALYYSLQALLRYPPEEDQPSPPAEVSVHGADSTGGSG